MLEGAARASGSLGLTVIRRVPPPAPGARQLLTFLREVIRDGFPLPGLTPEVRRWRATNLVHLRRGVLRLGVARALKLPFFHGALRLVPIYAGRGPVDLGLAGLRVVTTVGVAFLVDALQGSVEPEILKYHGIGTGSTGEDVGDSALVTELTTEYTGNVRATGNLAEGASANIFHTEGTNTLDESPGAALREHGIFSQAAPGGGTLLDRTVYAAITLASGDGLLSKYELTLSAGG